MVDRKDTVLVQPRVCDRRLFHDGRFEVERPPHHVSRVLIQGLSFTIILY